MANAVLFPLVLVVLALATMLSAPVLPLFTLPIFLFSAFAGRLADKFDRTRIMRFCKFAEIWLMLIVAGGFILREPLLLIVALFFMGVQSAFFAPAKTLILFDLDSFDLARRFSTSRCKPEWR